MLKLYESRDNQNSAGPTNPRRPTLNEPIPNDQTESVLRPRCRQLKRVRRRPSESRRERFLTTARRPANGTRPRMRPSTRRCVTKPEPEPEQEIATRRTAGLSSGKLKVVVSGDIVRSGYQGCTQNMDLKASRSDSATIGYQRQAA